MKLLTEWLQKTAGIPVEISGKVITSLACILVIWFLRGLLLKGVWRRTENSRTRYQWRKSSNYVSFAIAFLLLGRVWLEEFQAVATYLGLVSAGLAIAMRDPLVNVAGWIFIIWRHPFDVGDRGPIRPAGFTVTSPRERKAQKPSPWNDWKYEDARFAAPGMRTGSHAPEMMAP